MERAHPELMQARGEHGTYSWNDPYRRIGSTNKSRALWPAAIPVTPATQAIPAIPAIPATDTGHPMTALLTRKNAL